MRGFRNALITVAFWGACAIPLEESTDAGPAPMHRRNLAHVSEEEQGGSGTSLVFHLPMRAGDQTRCTQGPGGAFSHQSRSTLYGIDLDTSNTTDEEVFAPISGVARVHREDPTHNFGIHVNIDLGDGTFVLIGHLKEVFVDDYESVVEGQMLGFEGCTGACTGDHIHLGLQRGNAFERAERSEALPFSLFVWNHAQPDGIGETPAESVVCGVPGGELLHSVLPVACAHPDGTLVKTPGDAKVYRIDDGALRWIVDETVFQGYGYAFANVVLISAGEVETYGTGADIALPGMVDGRYDDDWQHRLFVSPRSRSDRYRIRVHDDDVWEVFLSWGLLYGAQDDPPVAHPQDPLMQDWPERPGFANFRDGSLLKEHSSSRVYAVSHGIPMPFADETAFRLAGYDFSRVIEVADGALSRHFPMTGICTAGGIGCLSQERFRSCLPIDASGFHVVGGSVEDTGSVGSEGQVTQSSSEEHHVDAGHAGTSSSSQSQGNASSSRSASSAHGTLDAGPADAGSTAPERRTMSVTWTMPLSRVAQNITLSGEYRLSDDSYGFLWQTLSDVANIYAITYELAGVQTGDSFRFSVEFEAVNGEVSWSCIGPFVPGDPARQGTRQGRAEATVDGVSVPVANADDPMSTGCGLIVFVP